MRAVLYGLLVAFAALSLACGFAGKRSTEATKGEPKKTYTREEFRSLIVGKTEAEVLATVGKPDSTTDGGVVYWHYKNRTVDPITGKADYDAQVVFKAGRVSAVNY